VDAFGELVDRFQDAVYGAAYAMLGDLHDVQDVAQDAFVQAWRDLGSLRDPAKFPAWLYRITTNRCRDFLRRPRRRAVPIDDAVPMPASCDQTDPAKHAERREMREGVLAAIRSLSEPNRLATALFYIDGYSVDEVAAFLDVPSGTVKRRLHDSRQQLKERMLVMVEDELKAQRPGADLRQRVVDELMARKARFDEGARAYYVDGNVGGKPKPDPEWVAWWHGRRIEDVRANAAHYGVEPDETLPRMLPEYRQSETFRDDFEDISRRWGIPEGVELISLRDFCRQIGATPLAVLRWEADGLQTLHYYPWLAFDLARATAWVEARDIQPQERMSAEEARELMLLALRAVAAGEASVEEGVRVLYGLEISVGRDGKPMGYDPLWADEWRARHDAERRENAKQYGLAEPAPTWLGAPDGACGERFFGIRGVALRLRLSPFDVIQWTKEGMPAVRRSPDVRWDVEHVAQWLAERGPLPEREYTGKELDSMRDFVVESVAAGAATPEVGRDVLVCWLGTIAM